MSTALFLLIAAALYAAFLPRFADEAAVDVADTDDASQEERASASERASRIAQRLEEEGLVTDEAEADDGEPEPEPEKVEPEPDTGKEPSEDPMRSVLEDFRAASEGLPEDGPEPSPQATAPLEQLLGLSREQILDRIREGTLRAPREPERQPQQDIPQESFFDGLEDEDTVTVANAKKALTRAQQRIAEDVERRVVQRTQEILQQSHNASRYEVMLNGALDRYKMFDQGKAPTVRQMAINMVDAALSKRKQWNENDLQFEVRRTVVSLCKELGVAPGVPPKKPAPATKTAGTRSGSASQVNGRQANGQSKEVDLTNHEQTRSRIERLIKQRRQ